MFSFYSKIPLSKGSLWDMIKQSDHYKLNEYTVRNYTRQILEGLDYLHGKHVIHRDLKSKNILIDAEGVIKLADFGLSLKLNAENSTSRQFNTGHGTCTHMAPEMFNPKFGKYGRKVDIWSLGVTMVEMLTGTHPWPDIIDNMPYIFKLIHLKDDELPVFELAENASGDLKDFLELTFKVHYAHRPTADILLKHSFLVT